MPQTPWKQTVKRSCRHAKTLNSKLVSTDVPYPTKKRWLPLRLKRCRAHTKLKLQYVLGGPCSYFCSDENRKAVMQTRIRNKKRAECWKLQSPHNGLSKTYIYRCRTYICSNSIFSLREGVLCHENRKAVVRTRIRQLLWNFSKRRPA